MNLFTFTGNLGRDAEVKYMPNGNAVCEFSVAVKSGYGDKEKTNWVRCAMFGKKADGQLPSYLTKGTQVAVSGELELQEWEGQNGKGAALSVIVGNIDLIGGKSQGNAPQGQNNQNQGGYAPQQQSAPQGGHQQQNSPQQGGQYQSAPQNQAPQQGGFQNQNGGYAPQQ